MISTSTIYPEIVSEIYYSKVNFGITKGWKKHNKMKMRLSSVSGSVLVVIYNPNTNNFFSSYLSLKNHQIIIIDPGLWVAFRGESTNSIIMNMASIEHDPTESDTIAIDKINFKWPILKSNLES